MSATRPPTLSSEQLADWLDPPAPSQAPYWVRALIGPYLNYLVQLTATDTILFYTFAESLPDYLASDTTIEGFAPIPLNQRDAVRTALLGIEQVIDLKFQETNDPNRQDTISLMTNRQQRTDGFAWGPGRSLKSYDVFLDNDPPVRIVEGQYDALALIHEVGHALGLRHSFEGSQSFDSGGVDPALNGTEESSVWTVMSYTSYKAQFIAEFRTFDIAALQWLYGPSKLVRMGDDRYVLSSKEANFIWDAGGFDTLDASHLDQVQLDFYGGAVGAKDDLRLVLDLRVGTKGYVDHALSRISLPGQITINAGTVIEAVIGTASRDWVYGNEASNRLEGRAGNDLLVGREGADSLYGSEGADSIVGGAGSDRIEGGEDVDWAFFEHTRSSYRIDAQLGDRYLIFRNNQGLEEFDELVGVERLHFADGTVILKEDTQGFWVSRLISLLGGAQALQQRAIAGYAISALDQAMTPEVLAGLGITYFIGAHASQRDVIAKVYQNLWEKGLVLEAPSEGVINGLEASATMAAMSPTELLLWACRLPATEQMIQLTGVNDQGFAIDWPQGS